MSPTGNRAVADSSNEIAALRIEVRGSYPPIWCQLEVPITLKVLHDISTSQWGGSIAISGSSRSTGVDTGCR